MAQVRKSCAELGCNKQAATGGLCVAHGGGKTCQFEGCNKGYQRGGFCRKHGGGSRCTVPFCRKVDAGGGLCRLHGGGKRCKSPECSKADVGGGYCTVHGGGKRCKFPLCDKNSQGRGYCRAHGGGRRCTEPDCQKMGKGTCGKCPDHGGPTICKTPNCRRIARDLEGYCLDHAEQNGNLSQSDESTQESSRPRALSLFMDPNPVVMMPVDEIETTFKYRRVLIQAQLQDPWSERRVHAILKAEPNVRSVHVLGYRHNVTRKPRTSVCFVVRGSMRPSSIAETFSHLQMRCTILEDSIVEDVEIFTECIFDVNGMMCMANCGNTVLRAVQNFAVVDQAYLEFEAAQLIVTSQNASSHAIISCLQAVGFEANLVSMQPIPLESRYTMELASKRRITADIVHTLETILAHVEGVEEVFFVQSTMELCIRGFFESNEVMLVASTHGVILSKPMMNVDTQHSSMDPVSSWSTTSQMNQDHECSFTCPSDGCSKYRTAMAHTAALAIGWAVPGCGMAMGYECTCGDDCKCVGCPTHNPATSNPLTGM